MPSSIPEIHDTLNEIESEHDLFERKVDDVRYWERVRNDVYDEVCNSLGVFGKANVEPGGSWKERFRGLYLLLRNVLVRNPYLADEHEFLFYGHPRRKQRDNGTWWDLYTDPILEEFDLDAVSIEYDHELRHYTPARSSPLKYTDLIEYSGTLYKMASRYSLPSEEADYLRKVETAFETKFGAEVDLAGFVREELTERQALVPLYERLLNRVKPEVVVLVVSYGKESFIEACQNVDIPVVELQHGSISKYHCGYSFPPGERKDAFPDYFFTFGSFWKTRLNLPLADEYVYDVGYPYLEQEVDKVPQNQKKNPDPDDKSILFISQGTIGAKLSKFAVEVAKSADKKHSVIYKLHPDEYSRWQDEYPWLVGSDVEVREEGSAPLYQLFASADVQVGVYSTAVYEGLYFDLETYVVDLDGVHYVQDLVDEGVITIVSSPQDLLIKLERDKTQEYDSNRFFRKGSIQEIKSCLNHISENKQSDQ